MKTVSLSILRVCLIINIALFSQISCGIKFGSDARQAAENAEKNKLRPRFVSVDSTEPDPPVVKASDANLDKAVKNDKPKNAKTGKPAKSVKPAAYYVRNGKNRRLRTALSQRLDNETRPKAGDSKQTPKTEQPIKIKSQMHTSKQVKPSIYPVIQLYGAKLGESEWLLSSTEMQCYLTQPIPRLGKAHFQFNPVQMLKFVFEVNHPIARKLKPSETRYQQPLLTDRYPYPEAGAKLESIPAIWNPFAIKKTLGFIPLKEGYKPFQLPHRQLIPATKAAYEMKRAGQQVVSIGENSLPEIWPDRIMGELSEGMAIRLTYRDWTDGSQDIIASISSVNFKQIKGDFEKCIAKLPKYDFKKFKQTKLWFNKGQRSLTKKMRRQLRNMVKFIKLDDKIKKVMIKSYTDSMGFKRINRNAAKVQAQAIKSYMRKLGFKAPITAIGIGEGPYVASNRSAAGRAKNRRSIITLIK